MGAIRTLPLQDLIRRARITLIPHHLRRRQEEVVNSLQRVHHLQPHRHNLVNRYLVNLEEAFKVTRNYKNIMGIIIANLIHRLSVQSSMKLPGYASCKVISLKAPSKADLLLDTTKEISYGIIPSQTSLACSQRMVC